LLYIVTAHHQDPRWIEIQTRFLRRHIREPFELWGSLEGISMEWHAFFDRVIPSVGNHSGKLNLLAAEVAHIAHDNDLIMFLDGDAFPIADPLPSCLLELTHSDLVAVQRFENNGDLQPHPCFAVTYVGKWRGFGGDWSSGNPWPTTTGEVTDVGGNLLRALERTGSSWKPLLRTNGTNDHPLFFGVYGHIVYHHGSGFRSGIGRTGAQTLLLSNSWGNLFLRKAVRRVLLGMQRYKVRKLSHKIFLAIKRDSNFLTQFNASHKQSVIT